jgi:hypothetical protein
MATRAKVYSLRAVVPKPEAPKDEARGREGVRTFSKETMASGRPARIECLEIGGQTYSIERGLASVVGVEDEWYDDVRDPAATIGALKQMKSGGPDLFTFWQRMPDVEARYPYHLEWDDLAVRRFPPTIAGGLADQVTGPQPDSQGGEGRARRQEAAYDDDFIRGMTTIFNESRVRQGRPFWHYGKDFETVKRQFSRFLFGSA